MTPTLVIGNNDGCELYKQTLIFAEKIIPNRVVQGKKLYEITQLDEQFHLDGFEISIENGKVMNVRVFGLHPNCNPDTDIFCLPDFKKGIPYNDAYLNMIITNIKTYYFDNAHFNHTGKYLKYEEVESFYLPAESLRRT